MNGTLSQVMRVISPLAADPRIRVGKAVFIAQLDFLCDRFGQTLQDGEKWFQASYSDLSVRFPFWCLRTIKKYVAALLREKILLKISQGNCSAFRIDVNRLSELTGVDIRECVKDGKNVCYFSPAAATIIGLAPAILLQQVLYWSKVTHQKSHGHSDRFPTPHHSFSFYKSLEEWGNDFPFWHSHTIFNLLHGLQSTGALFIEHKPNSANWYSIDFTEAISVLSTDAHEVSFKNQELAIEKRTSKEPRVQSPLPNTEFPASSPHIDRHFSELQNELKQMSQNFRSFLHYKPLLEVLNELKTVKRLHLADIKQVADALRFFAAEKIITTIRSAASTGKARWKRIWRLLNRIPIQT